MAWHVTKQDLLTLLLCSLFLLREVELKGKDGDFYLSTGLRGRSTAISYPFKSTQIAPNLLVFPKFAPLS